MDHITPVAVVLYFYFFGSKCFQEFSQVRNFVLQHFPIFLPVALFSKIFQVLFHVTIDFHTTLHKLATTFACILHHPTLPYMVFYIWHNIYYHIWYHILFNIIGLLTQQGQEIWLLYSCIFLSLRTMSYSYYYELEFSKSWLRRVLSFLTYST